MQTAKQLIDGQWVSHVAGAERFGNAINPANGEVAAQFCEGTAAEAEAAVAAALRAFENTDWKRSPRLRAQVLLDFADRLDARKEEIADWLVTLNGKLRREALGEIGAGISELRYYAGLARNLFGRVLEVEPGCYSSLDREAAGVCAIILPWNAPVTLLVRSLAPALAAGCTVVIKPACQTAVVNNMVLEPWPAWSPAAWSWQASSAPPSRVCWLKTPRTTNLPSNLPPHSRPSRSAPAMTRRRRWAA